METLTIQPDQEIEVPSVHEFRAWFDRFKCPLKEKALLEILYLSAARESDLCKKVLKWEVEHAKAKPYGELLMAEMTKYQMASGQVIPILLLRMGVAKHKAKEEISQNTEAVSQINYKVRVRYVPIPLKMEYEPFCLDILKFIQESKFKTDPEKKTIKIEFDITRRTIYNIVRRNLAIFEPAIKPHLLRHYRTSHLLEAYHFTPLELTSFVGWSIQTTSKRFGMASSSMIDIYAHSRWKSFVEKLLVPIDKIR